MSYSTLGLSSLFAQLKREIRQPHTLRAQTSIVLTAVASRVVWMVYCDFYRRPSTLGMFSSSSATTYLCSVQL